jgi:hypothetical protein
LVGNGWNPWHTYKVIPITTGKSVNFTPNDDLFFV